MQTTKTAQTSATTEKKLATIQKSLSKLIEAVKRFPAPKDPNNYTILPSNFKGH